MNFFFSVIIPVHNNLQLFKKTIKSLEKQRFKNFETIVIIDGPQLDILDFIKNFKSSTINLKYIKIPKYGGPARPRNIGIENSNSKWICFLDSDDEWLPEKLSEVYNVIKNRKNIDLIYHNTFLKKSNSIKKFSSKIYKKDMYINLLKFGNICSNSATSVNLNFIKQNKLYFNENKRFKSVEDFDFWLSIAKKRGRFYYLNKYLSIYNIHNNNLTKNIFWHKKRSLSLLFKHIFALNISFKQKKFFFRELLLLNKFEEYIICIFKKKKINMIFKFLIFIVGNLNTVFFYLKKKLV